MSMARIEQDMKDRWRPSDQQIAVAVAMLAVVPEASNVIVPLALPRKTDGFWTEDVQVEPVPGFWLVDSTSWEGPLSYSNARWEADKAAAAALNGRAGSTSFVGIRRDGTWAVFEGIAAAVKT